MWEIIISRFIRLEWSIQIEVEAKEKKIIVWLSLLFALQRSCLLNNTTSFIVTIIFFSFFFLLIDSVSCNLQLSPISLYPYNLLSIYSHWHSSLAVIINFTFIYSLTIYIIPKSYRLVCKAYAYKLIYYKHIGT